MAARPEATGDCFVAAFHLLLAQPPEMNARLVHGLVTHPHGRFRHIHAWVEIEGFVLDQSNGHDLVAPREVYYAAGEIVEEDLVRYTRIEVCKECVRHGTYGPWTDRFLAL